MEPETIAGRCPEGMEYVSAHRKRNGAYVPGFCRKKHNRITRHDREVDYMNLLKARQFKEEEPEQERKEEKAEEISADIEKAKAE